MALHAVDWGLLRQLSIKKVPWRHEHEQPNGGNASVDFLQMTLGCDASYDTM